jgi:two-component system cell cycle response regulator
MKVLIAEDEPISCRALEKSVAGWGYETVIAKNGKEAWEALRKNEVRIAVVDWMMPGMDGIELCQKIRHDYQQKKSKYTYIILLTGKDQQGDVITGLSAGADDYITKPFSFLELKVRIQNGERIIKVEDDQIELASYDSLTKVWNRKKILDFFKEELSRGRRENQATGVIIVDVDWFKNVNDSHGHFIGDEVLIEVVSRLKKCIRGYDKLGRYGGDELILVLPNCGLTHVKNVAERLRLSVCEKKISTKKGLLDVTISLGGISSDVSSEASTDELIQASDRALYSAKKRGRNKAVIIEHLEAGS